MKTEKTFLYTLARGIAAFLYPCVFLAKARGVENFPREENCIILSNHLSAWDPITIAHVYKHNEIHFIAKESLFRNPRAQMVSGAPARLPGQPRGGGFGRDAHGAEGHRGRTCAGHFPGGPSAAYPRLGTGQAGNGGRGDGAAQPRARGAGLHCGENTAFSARFGSWSERLWTWTTCGRGGRTRRRWRKSSTASWTAGRRCNDRQTGKVSIRPAVAAGRIL